MNIFNSNTKTTMHPMNLPLLPALRRLLPLCLLLLALPAAQSQTASPPSQMSFQGYLTDQAGNPLGATNTGPKNYTVVFRIYDAATGGNELHAEQQTVTVNNGYFSILLGQGSPYTPEPNVGNNLASIFTGSKASSRFVEMMVVGIGASGTANVTLAPRLQLVSSPYAYLAANAVNSLNATGLVNTNGNVSAVYVFPGNGDVGIGTTSPSQQLEVGGNAQIDGFLSASTYLTAAGATSTHGTPGAYLEWNKDGTGGTSFVNQKGSASGGFHFDESTTGNTLTERMTITSSGLVGIGTSTPAQMLEVNGSEQLDGGLSLTGSLYLINAQTISAKNASGSYENFLWPRNSDNVTYLNFGSGGFNIRNNNSGNVMWLGNNNYVGIGTTTPSQLLEVNGNAKVDGTLTVNQLNLSQLAASQGIFVAANPGISAQATPQGAYIQWNRSNGIGETDFINQQGAGSGGFYFDQINTNNGITQTAMVIGGNGYVGIGTTSPQYPLDIEGNGPSKTIGKYSFMSSSSYDNGRSGTTANFGLYCASRILCGSELDVTSDARVKQIVGRSDTKKDLATIRQLKITDYRKIDQVQYGSQVQKGVIAQEVAPVVPEAVSTCTNFIPNIYALPETFGCTNGYLTVAMAKPHGLVGHDLLRLMTDVGQLDVPVAKVKSDRVFIVGPVNKVLGHIFVYGKQVGDLREVNYDRLFTTG